MAVTYFAEGWVVAVDSNVSKSALMIFDFTMVGASVGLFEAHSEDIGVRICLQHSALLYNAHIVYVNDCQGGEIQLLILSSVSENKKGKFANENTG